MFNFPNAKAVFQIKNIIKFIAVVAIITPAIAYSQGVNQGLIQGVNQDKFTGIGRAATSNEVTAWDIDVRPDFKGLPKGMGSVSQGEKVWEAQCASCHGSFGENNAVFSALAGYTTKKDVETGRVASLLPDAVAPTRTTMMKVSQLSTLWDYINRAMPWTAPKSLTPNEVYAVTAYLLNLGNVVPDDFTLSDQNIAETQKKLPNRAGMTTAHAMWPGNEFGGTAKPDTQGSDCMTNCKTEVHVASFIPEYARNAHGNIADQNRTYGQFKGANTSSNSTIASVYVALSAPKMIVNPVVSAAPDIATKAAPKTLKSADVMPTLNKYACTACHGMDNKIVGPSFRDIAAKQAGKTDAAAYLAGKIKGGSSGVYGSIPMPPQSLGEVELLNVVKWITSGAAK
jgi:S-disulfanyl-L-cysteine oxidoreductase SoxD